MAEYIEREAAIKVLRGKAIAKYPASFYMGLFAASNELGDIPSADVAPVVRCKHCKHRGWVQEPCHGKSVDFCRVWDSCINNIEKRFCSYGERKEGAD